MPRVTILCQEVSTKKLKENTMSKLVNRPYDTLQEGDSATFEKTLTERELVLFAAVSGDVNPVHLDAEFAKTSMFGERIAHGMWSGSLISAALATTLPGPGTIYLGQDLSFRRPVKLNDTLTVSLTVKEKQDAKKIVIVDCLVTNQNSEKVVTGTAKVIAPTEKVELDAPQLPEIKIG
jgi:acyl dehydratase